MATDKNQDDVPSAGDQDLVTAAVSKEAGISVYLMEELTDARLRCDQLKKFIDQAVRHISKSTHRDHFYEVAGDLIYGIPDALFRLDKALDAAALAASRLDYEELKQQLKPEKVEELERVLKDVRIRHIDRRSPNIQPKPEGFSPSAQEKTAMFKAASTDRIAGALHRIADEIGTANISPREATLRMHRVLMALAQTPEEALQAVRPFNASDPDAVMKLFASANPDLTVDQLTEIGVRWAGQKKDEDKQSRFEEGKPADPTENMSPEDAKKWKEEHEKNKDKFKSAAGDPQKQIDGGVKDLEGALKSLSRARSALNDAIPDDLANDLDKAAKLVAKCRDRISK